MGAWYKANGGRDQWLVTDDGRLVDARPLGSVPGIIVADTDATLLAGPTGGTLPVRFSTRTADYPRGAS